MFILYAFYIYIYMTYIYNDSYMKHMEIINRNKIYEQKNGLQL